MNGELLIGLDEAARRLAVCRRSVQTLVYSGELRAVRIGRSRRISVVDLEDYVNGLRKANDGGTASLAGRMLSAVVGKTIDPETSRPAADLGAKQLPDLDPVVVPVNARVTDPTTGRVWLRVNTGKGIRGSAWRPAESVP